MNTTVVIRPYAPRDRDALRIIACDTAAGGKPVECFVRDREVVADCLTRYYTDYEPQAVWTAECEGRVIGYLTGCLDTRRYQRIMRGRIVPKAALTGLLHGAWLSGQAWRLLGAGLMMWLGGGFRRREFVRDYPAHLHLNIQEGFRRQQVGQRLIERFCAQAKAAGCSGVHVGVREDNEPARHFFERRGFIVMSRQAVIVVDGRVLRPHHAVIYGKRL